MHMGMGMRRVSRARVLSICLSIYLPTYLLTYCIGRRRSRLCVIGQGRWRAMMIR